MIKTGIQTIDNSLNGGIKEKAKVLIISNPEIEKLQFAQQITYTNLKDGHNVIYITNNKKSSILKSRFKEYEWDISKFEKNKRCRIIDLYERVLKKEDIKKIQKDIEDSMKKNSSESVIVIDSLSSFLEIYGTKKEVLESINQLINLKGTIIALVTSWPYKNDVISKIKAKCDCVIELKAIEKEIILRNYFTISKAQWIKKLKKESVLFEVIKPGGIREFVPKILVTGPFHAGKSTFTHAISTKATSVDRLGTTVALDYGHINYKGYSADVFGTPGQSRFDPLLKVLKNKAVGIFLVINPSKPESFERAKKMLELCETSLLPTVVIANKRLSVKSLSQQEIKTLLKLSKDIPIVECDALKKEGLNKALDIFFKQLDK